MRNAIYVLVIVVGLAAIAAKLGLVEIPWLSERLAGPVPEEPATVDDPLMTVSAEPVPKEEPKLEVAEAKPEAEEAKPAPPPPSESEAQPQPEPAPDPEPHSDAAPAGPVPPDEVVADLHGKYEAALASQADEPFEAATAKLTASYLAALEREEQAAQAAADLDALLHWRNERMRMESQPAAGEPRGGPPAKLVEMRRTYEAETAKLTEGREAKEAELKNTYDVALAAHEKSLTQALKVDEALAVREWREPYRTVAGAEPESVAAEVPALGASGASVRLTLAEIDRGEVGSELEIVLPGGIPMVFCWCPPGEFLMGSPAGEEGREDYEVQHRVRLTKGFWLAKTETTQRQWESVMGTSIQEMAKQGTHGKDLYGTGSSHPM